MLISRFLYSMLGASAMAIAGSMLLSRDVVPFPPLATVAPAQAAVPLDESLYGKPVVVEIYAKWCTRCQTIAPTLATLRKQYKGKIHYIAFDVSDPKTSQRSAQLAKSYGLSTFFDNYKARTSTVAIFDPLNGHIVKIYQNNRNFADYKTILEQEIRRQDSGSI
jgi:thiol-disulfide isomerase/thioredoxin